MINCETCKWRSDEIGYYSPCPSHDKHEKEIPFLANLRVDDEKCMYCGGEGAMCQKCKEKNHV